MFKKGTQKNAKTAEKPELADNQFQIATKKMSAEELAKQQPTQPSAQEVFKPSQHVDFELEEDDPSAGSKVARFIKEFIKWIIWMIIGMSVAYIFARIMGYV